MCVCVLNLQEYVVLKNVINKLRLILFFFSLKVLVQRSNSTAELDLKADFQQTHGNCREREKSEFQEIQYFS